MSSNVTSPHGENMNEKYLMRKNDIVKELGIPKSTLNRWIADGIWPKPIKLQGLSKSSTAFWKREDIYAFIDSMSEKT